VRQTTLAQRIEPAAHRSNIGYSRALTATFEHARGSMQAAAERRALTVILTAILIDAMGFGIIMPVMPRLLVGLTHASLSDAARIAGWLLGSFAAMQFVFGPVMGGLGDRFGRRPVLLLSMFAFGVDYLVMGLSPTLSWLFVSRAFAGVAGAIFVPAAAYVADITPRERRAQSFGLVGAAFGLGFVIGPGVGGLLGHFGPRAPFFAAATLAMANAASGLFMLPESLPLDRRRAFSLARANPFGTFVSLARHRGILMLFAAWFPWMLAHQSYPSVWAFFTKIKFGWSEGAIGLSLSYVGLVLACSQAFLTPRLVPALGERRAILIGLTSGMIGFVGNAIVPAGWMIYPVIALAGLQGLVMPSMNSILSKTVAVDQQGELQGGVSSLLSASAILGPPLMTHALAFFTRPKSAIQFPGAAFLLAGALTAIAMLTVLAGGRRIFDRALASRDMGGTS
jgi:DHA1 family tetracycline resistance protein-like MFS transporter